MNATRTLTALTLAGTLTGCGVSHIKEYTPPTRDYQMRVADAPAAEKQCSPGSLWCDRDASLRSGSLYNDVRAHEINDTVLVKVVERASASREAATNLEKGGSLGFGADVAGVVAGAGITNPIVDVNGNIVTNNQGSTSRNDEVRFTLAATVTKVLPNGNLFVEGYKVVKVNGEEHHYSVSGVVRLQDLQADNSILSSQLADAEIEFGGRGVITDVQEPGWLQRVWSWISPF